MIRRFFKGIPMVTSMFNAKLAIIHAKMKSGISNPDIQAKEIRLSELTTTKETTTNGLRNCWHLLDKLIETKSYNSNQI